MTTASGTEPRKEPAAVTMLSAVCRVHVFDSMSCATCLIVVVCQAAFLESEPDDFGAFLEDYPLDFTHAGQETVRWCPLLKRRVDMPAKESYEEKQTAGSGHIVLDSQGSQEIKGVTLSLALRSEQCTTLGVKRARCLEKEEAAADEFMAFLEDSPLDFTPDDEATQRWCPWLPLDPLASPPTPPLTPRVKASSKEQLPSSESVPLATRRRRWSRSLQFPEEYRCREGTAGETAPGEVACLDEKYTNDVPVIQKKIQGGAKDQRLRRTLERSLPPTSMNGHFVTRISNETGFWRDKKNTSLDFYVCTKCGQAVFSTRNRYNHLPCEEECRKPEAKKDQKLRRRVSYLNRIYLELEMWRVEAQKLKKYHLVQPGIDVFSNGLQAAREELLQSARALRLGVTTSEASGTTNGLGRQKSRKNVSFSRVQLQVCDLK